MKNNSPKLKHLKQKLENVIKEIDKDTQREKTYSLRIEEIESRMMNHHIEKMELENSIKKLGGF